MRCELPEGWRWRPLSEFAAINKKALSSHTPKGFAFRYFDVSSAGDSDHGMDEDLSGWTTFGAAPSRARRLAEKGDVVYATIRPLLRRIMIAAGEPDHVYSTGFATLGTGDPVASRYLYHCLSSDEVESQIYARVAGSNFPALGSADLAALEVPWPPTAQLKLIVAVLDEWDQAASKVEELAKLKRLEKNDLLSRTLRDLPKVPLTQAASVWFSGVDKKHSPNEQQILLCNFVDVFHNTRVTGDLPFMEGTASPREIAQNSLRRNDVVFTKDSETADDIAEPALVAEDIENLVCGYHLAVARPKDGYASGPFLVQAMRHPEMRWQFRRLANGVVRFGLTLEALEQVEIFLPDLHVQERLGATFELADQIVEQLDRQARLLRAQKRGLMQKLLTGGHALSEALLDSAA